MLSQSKGVSVSSMCCGVFGSSSAHAERQPSCRIVTAEVTSSSVGKHTEGKAGGKFKKEVEAVVFLFICLFVLFFGK